MKKAIITSLLIVFSLFSCKQKESKSIIKEKTDSIIYNNSNIENIDIGNFIGDWEIEPTSSNSNTYSIHLSKNDGGLLEGYYCAVVRNGSKIDCSPQKELNIKEIKKDNQGYLVFFKSFFDAKNGEAKISLSGGKLHWHIIKKPIGEFYCPLDIYLSKKNDNISSNNKLTAKININNKNYKETDITMQLYKDIIDYYSCGDNSVSGMSLGKSNSYEIFIVENNCGDFPFKDLISVKNGKIINRLLIESSSFDIEKSEHHNKQVQVDLTFNIDDLSNIYIQEVHSINNKIQSNYMNNYFMDNQGIFHKK